MIRKAWQLAGLAMALAVAACACGDRPRLVDGLDGGGAQVPMSGELRLSPASLPQGATASYPAFDGDAFSVVLPVRAQGDLAPAQALEEIEPVLRAVGFERSVAELRVPDQPVALPPVDLEPLAEEVCREAALQQDQTARESCATLSQGDLLYAVAPRAEDARASGAEAAFRRAYGVSSADFRAQLERPVLQYPFAQVVGGVLIDGAGVFASRRSGESLSTVHGTLFNEYKVVNRPAGDAAAVLEAARQVLGRRLGGQRLPELDWREPVLVLLAYGSARTAGGGEVPALRHAWRALVEGRDGRSWLVWVDAETAEVLKLTPQWDHAQGERWRRDPGLAKSTEVVPFEVNPASGGQLVLALTGVFRRPDRFGDGIFDDGDEVAVPAGSDFNVFPIDDEAEGLCDDGSNPAYRQVHAYSHLYSLWKTITSAGSIPAFPEKPIRILVDVFDSGVGSQAFYDTSTLEFVDGDGFLDFRCPDRRGERLNGVQDTTTLAHEMAHLSVKRLQDRRPRSWCGSADCQLPNGCGRALFHDFADAVGVAYASTNCFSGWTHKNMDGTNANLYCSGRVSEDGALPRRIELPRDRFPDHHGLGTGPYADGQIAAAALWAVRQGLRSKDPAAGTVLFWARLQRALWNYAFLQPTCLTGWSSTSSGILQGCRTCDRDRYRYLQDLERRMVEQWALAGVPDGHTANKVLAGWAAAGIFLVPQEEVGDAVIDADDRDADDDLKADGVTHPEVDYLERGPSVPGFRVWTGPRFRLDPTGRASTSGTPPCNTRYRVEVSEDAGFAGAESVEGVADDCYAEVDFPGWAALQGTEGETKVLYYRVTTWDPGPERISTAPGAGAFHVPPPFVVVDDSGRP